MSSHLIAPIKKKAPGYVSADVVLIHCNSDTQVIFRRRRRKGQRIHIAPRYTCSGKLGSVCCVPLREPSYRTQLSSLRSAPDEKGCLEFLWWIAYPVKSEYWVIDCAGREASRVKMSVDTRMDPIGTLGLRVGFTCLSLRFSYQDNQAWWPDMS